MATTIIGSSFTNMRKTLFITFITLATLLTPSYVHAKVNWFIPGYCTWYAASEFNRQAPEPGINWSGNAGSWLFNAMGKGWAVNSSPAAAEVGALIVWQDYWLEGRVPCWGFGHVGVVSSIDWSRRTLTVTEMNWGPRKPGTSTQDAISVNFGRITTIQPLPWSNLNRVGASATYFFQGFIFPRRSTYIYNYRG